MEYPAAPTAAQLEELLTQIIQGTNIVETEKYFKHYLKLKQSISDLIQQLTQNPNLSIRQLASVLLRKKILFHWANLDSNEQSFIKSTLINQLQNDSEHLVRKNIANLIATLSTLCIKDWPELLELIDQLTKSDNVQAKEIGLYLLSEMLEDENVNAFLEPHSQQLLQLFTASLNDTSSRNIRKYALTAISNHATNTGEIQNLEYIRQLVPQVLTALEEAIQDSDVELVVAAILVFDNLLDSGMDIDQHLELISKVVMEKVAMNSDFELLIRESAIDFLELITEVKNKSLGQNQPMLLWMLQSAFTIASEGSDDTMESSPLDMSMRFIDTCALNLSNRVVYAPLIELIEQLRQNSSAAHRRASILALGVIAEGCSDYMKQNLNNIVNTIVQAFSDPAPEVREAAGLALGYCSEHLKPEILSFHAQILPPLITELPNAPVNVKKKALFAIDTFCESFDEEIESYLPQLIPILVQLIKNDSNIEVRQKAISALTSSISSADKKISPYYQEMIKLLADLIQNEPDDEIKATAIQCLGHLGVSGTLEAFQPYLTESVQTIVQIFELGEERFRLREAAFAFFYLIGRLIGNQIQPYAEYLFQQAFISARREEKIDVKLDDSDEEEEEEEGVQTVFLDEKTAALHTIGQVFICCPQYLPQYVGQALETLELLWNYYHTNIRVQVITTYQQILEAATPNNVYNDDSKNLISNTIFPKFIDRINKDTEKEVVCRAVETVEELITQYGNWVFNNAEVEVLVQTLEVLLDEQATCQLKEEELADEDRDHDEILMGPVCDILQALAKNWGDAFSASFSRLITHIARFTKSGRNLRDRNLFTGCLADCITHMPAAALNHANDLAELVLINLQSEEELHRNTAYFLGMLCQQTGQALSGLYPTFLQALHPFFINDVEPATVDNAVAAVGRMIVACPQAVPLESVLPPWFNKLPLQDDFEEVKTVIRTLVFMLESGIDLTAWKDKTIQILIDALVVQISDPDLYKIPEELLLRVKVLLKQMSGDPELQAVGSKLSPEMQGILAQALQ